jgi:hypothetical protein
VQASNGFTVPFYSEEEDGRGGLSGGSYERPVPLPLRNVTRLDVTCFLTTNQLFRVEIRQLLGVNGEGRRVARAGTLSTSPALSKPVFIDIRQGETIQLGGLLVTNRIPIFSEISMLDRFPPVGHLLNRLWTYPTREVVSEISILLCPRILPTPEAAERSRPERDRLPGIRRAGPQDRAP